MTPVHCLPVEILIQIFHIIFDVNPSPIALMLVCRRWYNAIEVMPGLQIPLELQTWATPEIVRRAASHNCHSYRERVSVEEPDGAFPANGWAIR